VKRRFVVLNKRYQKERYIYPASKKKKKTKRKKNGQKKKEKWAKKEGKKRKSNKNKNEKKKEKIEFIWITFSQGILRYVFTSTTARVS
jgi:hypothetical protein